MRLVPRELEPRRTTSPLAKLDDLLLVAAIVVGAIFVLQVISWLAGTILFLIKAAIVVALVVAGVAWFGRRR